MTAPVHETAEDLYAENQRLREEIERLADSVNEIDGDRSEAAQERNAARERVAELERFIAEIAEQWRRS